MSSTVALSPVTAVYSLLREPSLALLWTHGYTFHVRYPSHARILPLDRGSAHGSRQPRAAESKKEAGGRWRLRNSPASLRAAEVSSQVLDPVIYVS